MPKYHITKRVEGGKTEEWDIKSTTYLQAHLDVLRDEGYYIELAPEEKKEIKISTQNNERD
jgi:hypothetical protein